MMRSDKIVGVMVVLLGGVVILLSLGLPHAARPGIPGPALLPRLVAGALVLCGILLFLRPTVRKEEGPSFVREGRRRLTGVILLVVFTAIGLSFVGFVISCLVSSFLFLVILGARVKVAVPTAAAITAGIYVVFHYGLQVQFPTGTVW